MKPLLVISCPIDTFSGYGARSRDIAKSIIDSDRYEVIILPQRWGNTPMGFLKHENPDHKRIIKTLHYSNELPKKPDVWIQITVPKRISGFRRI
jgi:hypothetical protein